MVADDEGSGPAVLLLHGQPGRARDWRRVRARLSDEARVLSPDRPGYGRTGGDAAGFGANADGCVALLDRLDVDRAIVCGHSWGGGVALAMAARHPDRVGGLVLVASVAPGAPAGLVDRFLASRPAGEVLTLATFEVGRRFLGTRQGRTLLGRALPASTSYALVGMTDVLPEAGDWRSFAVEQRAYVSELPGLVPDLATIAVPVEVVAGTDDRIVGYPAATTLRDALPTAVLRAVPGAGHLLPRDHPDHVAAAIRRALDRSGLSPDVASGR